MSRNIMWTSAPGGRRYPIDLARDVVGRDDYAEAQRIAKQGAGASRGYKYSASTPKAAQFRLFDAILQERGSIGAQPQGDGGKREIEANLKCLNAYDNYRSRGRWDHE